MSVIKRLAGNQLSSSDGPGSDSIFDQRDDLQSGAKQGFSDTFRNLFSLLRIYSTIWMVFADIGNYCCDYRIDLMLIGHKALQAPGRSPDRCRLSTLRLLRLFGLLGHISLWRRR